MGMDLHSREQVQLNPLYCIFSSVCVLVVSIYKIFEICGLKPILDTCVIINHLTKDKN